MHFVFLILALIAILLFLRPKEKFQPAFNRLTAPGEINLRKLVATTIDLPMGVIDIVRGYDFPGQVVPAGRGSPEVLQIRGRHGRV